MPRIAIHGFGRIGRSAVRIGLRDGLFVPAAISDVNDPATLAALFEVDTEYGRWPEPVRGGEESITIGAEELPYVNAAEEIPDWGAMGIDLVIDCTGNATRRNGAEAHLERGAGRVLVSAASKSLDDCDAVLLPGINMDRFDPERHRIISMASCTTNALAPVVKVLSERFGLRNGFFSTVHPYTGTQSLTDRPMRERRYSWGAAGNIIPTSSGAQRALGYLWPDIPIHGKAWRVPLRTGSVAELTANLEVSTSADDIRDAFRSAAESEPLKGILSVLEDEWASSRIIGDPHSSIIDLPLVDVIDGTTATVSAWYDNEMGYARRLAETAVLLAGSLVTVAA